MSGLYDAMQDARQIWDTLPEVPAPRINHLFADELDPYSFLASSLFTTSETMEAHHHFLYHNPHVLRPGRAAVLMSGGSGGRTVVLVLHGGVWDLHHGGVQLKPDASTRPLDAARLASMFVGDPVPAWVDAWRRMEWWGLWDYMKYIDRARRMKKEDIKTALRCPPFCLARLHEDDNKLPPNMRLVVILHEWEPMSGDLLLTTRPHPKIPFGRTVSWDQIDVVEYHPRFTPAEIKRRLGVEEKDR